MLRSAGARRLRKTLRRCPARAKIAQRIASWTWDVTISLLCAASTTYLRYTRGLWCWLSPSPVLFLSDSRVLSGLMNQNPRVLPYWRIPGNQHFINEFPIHPWHLFGQNIRFSCLLPICLLPVLLSFDSFLFSSSKKDGASFRTCCLPALFILISWFLGRNGFGGER